MKRIVSILTGMLCTFTFFVSAEELTAEDVDSVVEEVASPEASIPEAEALETEVVTDEDLAVAEVAIEEVSEPAVIPEADAEAVTEEVAEPAVIPETDAEAVTEEVAIPEPAVIPETDAEAVTEEVATPEVQQPAVVKGKNVQPKQKKNSWWDKILKLFKISDDKTRTCDQALAKMMNEKTIAIDFSNTSDFAKKGDSSMTSYYKTLVDTKSFGTHSSNLYMNLSKTGVSNEFITKWSKEFKKAEKIILWNFSYNETINDTVVDAIDLASVYSLNLSKTLVTDVAIAKIASILETRGIGRLVCVNLSGTKVTDNGIASLKKAIQTSVAAWKTKNPGKEYALEGADESGVIFEKLPVFPKTPKLGTPKPNLKLNANKAKRVAPPQPVATVEPVIETTEIDLVPEVAETIPETNPETIPEVAEQAPVETAIVETTDVEESVEGEANAALNEVDAIIASAETDSIQVDTMPETESQALEPVAESTDPTTEEPIV